MALIALYIYIYKINADSRKIQNVKPLKLNNDISKYDFPFAIPQLPDLKGQDNTMSFR